MDYWSHMLNVQQDLIALAAEGRLIPFLGAGFSSSLGLPSWESMLREICDSLEGAVPFDELMASTNNDLLQAAEYLYLRHDKQIGPLRHRIERSFSQHSDPVLSGPHVELANLGAGQVYTTNYDDMIEQTHISLGLPVSPVILPKDVALASSTKTQVIKYHGDLTHERTLILTESAYYKRLDFESPMDLKFRSDLLGKSVLFIGYSFRDINIRIIWFKLMDMMKDIPEADRRPSYIVRFEHNPALEELYAAVGLKTIVLNPEGKVLSDKERTALVGNFLLSLNVAAGTHVQLRARHGSGPFVSAALISDIDAQVARIALRPARMRRFRLTSTSALESAHVDRLLESTVPPKLAGEWRRCVASLLDYLPPSEALISALRKLEDDDAVGRYVIRFLAGGDDPEGRLIKKHITDDSLPWDAVWRTKLELREVDELLYMFFQEIRWQAEKGADSDIIYLADLVNRIAAGQIGIAAPADSSTVMQEALDASGELLRAASLIYPSISSLEASGGKPKVRALQSEVSHRVKAFESVNIDADNLRRSRPISSLIERHFKDRA